MSVTRTITTSKPFYVVAGAGDLAVKTLRQGGDRLASLRPEPKDVAATITSLQAETKALPAKAQTVAVTLAADVAGRVGNGYDGLLGRGRRVVTRIRRQKSNDDLHAQGAATVRRAKAAASSAMDAVDDTRSAARGTVTTAKKRASTTRKAVGSTAGSARKTTAAARKATAAGTSKIGR